MSLITLLLTRSLETSSACVNSGSIVSPLSAYSFRLIASPCR
jgi:hypothetical protein